MSKTQTDAPLRAEKGEPEPERVGEPVGVPAPETVRVLERTQPKTAYIIFQEVMVGHPADDSNIVPGWVEVARVREHTRDAAVRGVFNAMVEQDARTMQEATADIMDVTLVAIPESSFFPRKPKPRLQISLDVG